VTPVNPGADVPDGEASSSDIEIIGLNRAGIRVKAECSGVTFFVPATGADYVNVWIPEIFGLKYGPNPVNEEFTIKFEPGTYKYQLAVEKKTGDPAKPIAQDDRHRGEFTVECDGPPPPPPTCQGEECNPPDDVCPNIAGIQASVPVGLIINEAGQCVPPPPIDVCPNIQGAQSEVPQGLFKDEAGNCVEIPKTCQDFEKPSLEAIISGEPGIATNAENVTVTQGTIVADSFSVFFPLVTARPDFGQESTSWSFTATKTETVSYGPDGLGCSVSDTTTKEFSGEVDPKEPTCAQVNEPSYEVSGPTQDKRYYYELDEVPGSDNDTNRQALCTSNGGTYLNDSNDTNGFNPSFGNVCRVSSSNNTLDDAGNDEDFRQLVTASVTFFNAGGSAKLHVGNTTKDQESVQVSCGEQGFVNLSYGWTDAHENSTFQVTVIQ
jgi:hypothetical protein